MERFTTTFSMSLGGDTPSWEGEVTVAYSINPDEPEVGPTRDHGGLPFVPAEAVDIDVTHIDGVAIAQRENGYRDARDLEDAIECSDRLMLFLVERAAEQELV